MAFNPFVRWSFLVVLLGAAAVSSDSLDQRVAKLEEQIRELTRKVDRNYESIKMDLAKKQDKPAGSEEPSEPVTETSAEKEPPFPNDQCRKANGALTCGSESYGWGWIVVQQRWDGSVDFNRNWAEYRDGFGEVAEDKEFWWGLEKVYQRTRSNEYELLIQLVSSEGELRHIRHTEFVIADEKDKYKLKTLRGYSGDGGNVNYIEPESLILGQKFSTKDSDNDSWNAIHCAHTYGGGWWWNKCGRSLNSIWENLIIWPAWKEATLKATRIMIRARQ